MRTPHLTTMKRSRPDEDVRVPLPRATSVIINGERGFKFETQPWHVTITQLQRTSMVERV